MKKILFILVIIVVISCKKDNQENFGKPTEATTQKPEELGKEIFDGKGVCYTCHKPETQNSRPVNKRHR